MVFSAFFSTLIVILGGAFAYLFWFEGMQALHQLNLLDKAAHFLSFFLLNGIILGLLRLQQIVLLPGLVAYAALTELGQGLLDFRAAQWHDFYADVAGCLTFTLIYVTFTKLIQQYRVIRKQAALATLERSNG